MKLFAFFKSFGLCCICLFSFRSLADNKMLACQDLFFNQELPNWLQNKFVHLERPEKAMLSLFQFFSPQISSLEEIAQNATILTIPLTNQRYYLRYFEKGVEYPYKRDIKPKPYDTLKIYFVRSLSDLTNLTQYNVVGLLEDKIIFQFNTSHVINNFEPNERPIQKDEILRQLMTGELKNFELLYSEFNSKISIAFKNENELLIEIQEAQPVYGPENIKNGRSIKYEIPLSVVTKQIRFVKDSNGKIKNFYYQKEDPPQRALLANYYKEQIKFDVVSVLEQKSRYK